MKQLLFFTLLIFSTKAFSSITFGSYTAAVQKYQINNSAETNSFELNPYIGMESTKLFLQKFGFKGHVGVAFHRNIEDEYSKKTFFVDLMGLYTLYPRILFEAGFGVVTTNISGDGETKNINGDTLYAPSFNIFSYNIPFILGVEGRLTTKWSLNLRSYLFKLLDPDSFTYAYILGVSVKW